MNFEKVDDKVITAYEKILSLYEDREGVLSVEIGLITEFNETTDEVGIIIYMNDTVSEKSLDKLEQFPKTVDDIKINIIEEKEILLPSNQRSEKFEIIQAGISISSNYSTSGTLGLLVNDNKSNKPCILSNWHVLARYKSFSTIYLGSRSYRKGAPVYQPGRLHGGRKKQNIIARLSRHSRSLDAAIATLIKSKKFDTKQLESDINISAIRSPEIGDILEKSGARTGVTRAKVVSISNSSFTLKPVSENDDIEISDSGDSGALWYDPETREAVGLHFAGEKNDRYSEFARAKNIVLIFDRLDISLLEN